MTSAGADLVVRLWATPAFAWWVRHVAASPQIAVYARRTDRDIRVLRLVPLP